MRAELIRPVDPETHDHKQSSWKPKLAGKMIFEKKQLLIVFIAIIIYIPMEKRN